MNSQQTEVSCGAAQLEESYRQLLADLSCDSCAVAGRSAQIILGLDVQMFRPVPKIGRGSFDVKEKKGSWKRRGCLSQDASCKNCI